MKIYLQINVDWCKIMKVTFSQIVIMLIFTGMSYATSGKAQATLEKKVDFTMSNSSLNRVLKQLEKETNLKFVYSRSLIQDELDISIAASNEKLGQILHELLQPRGINYEIINDRVVLSKATKGSAVTYSPLTTNDEKGITASQVKTVAQVITGVVTDKNNQPLAGVSVLVKGTQMGTISDVSGKYTINVSDQSATLVFSFMGFRTQEVIVGGRTAINVQLIETSNSLNEVVVIGYGTQRKIDLTGSLTSVSTKDFAQQPVTRIDQVLEGRAAGVQVTNASGAPGADVRIRIRGANSVQGDNNPLYVIDGFVGGDFNTINPNDIETINVLKDAASTAIYGSRGANGVVIITTKKGSSGFKVAYEAQGSSSEVAKKWDVLNALDFANIANTRAQVLGTNPIFTPAQVSQFQNNGGTDWQNLVFRRANGQQHQLTFSGGGDKTTYLISGNYINQNGIVNNTGFKRYTFRSNINSQPSENFSLRFNVTGSRIENDNTGMLSGTGNPIVQALSWSPTTSPYDASGNITSSDPIGSVGTNPLALLYDQSGQDNRNHANAIGGLNYKLPVKGLAIDLQYGIDYLNVQDAYTAGSIISRGNPSSSRNSNEVITLQSTSSLNYNRTFGTDHNISAVLVFESQKTVANSFSGAANGLFFPTLGYYNLSLANSFSASAGYTEYALLSYLGRVNYSYKDKYLLSLAVRRDGSSKFANGNKYSTFPSIGLGYNMSDEDFIKDLNVFSNLKVRASWGMTGSQAISPYATLSKYNTGTPAAFDYSSVLYGIQLGNPGNLNLKWETTKQTDVGLEMGFLENRLTFEGDYFIKHTSDLLLNQALPAYVGGGSQTKNVGAVENRGFEVTLTANLFKTSRFNWTTNFNFAVVKNKVTSLGGIASRIAEGSDVGSGQSITNEFEIEPGYSLGSYWGVRYLGTWKPNEATEAAKYNQKPGDSHYQDLNNDGQINGDDFQIIGKGIPTTTLGWNNTFSYKNFTLNVFLQGVYGVDKLDYTRAVALSGAGDARQFILSEIKDRYIPGVNEASNIPAFSSTNVNLTQSSRFVEDGSYLRMKNVSLAYTFQNVINHKGSIRVFVSGTNLFTITKYKGLDPEANNIGSGTDTAQGIDYGAYPNARVYTAGINLSY